MKRIDRYATDASFNRFAELVTSLVVAVKVDLFGRVVGGHGKRKFAAGDHVDVEPLLLDDFENRRVGKGFAGIGDLGVGIKTPKVDDKLTTHVPDRRFVVNVDRTAELFDDIANVQAVDG